MGACASLLFTVTQLQTTLASVQELLVQQQKKIQELSQELADSHVSFFYSLKLALRGRINSETLRPGRADFVRIFVASQQASRINKLKKKERRKDKRTNLLRSHSVV